MAYAPLRRLSPQAWTRARDSLEQLLSQTVDRQARGDWQQRSRRRGSLYRRRSAQTLYCSNRRTVLSAFRSTRSTRRKTMKLVSRTFDPPFKVPIGDGFDLVVIAAGPAPKSGVRADLEIWNGDIQHADRGIVVSAARGRAEFAAAVETIQPAVDRAALD